MSGKIMGVQELTQEIRKNSIRNMDEKSPQESSASWFGEICFTLVKEKLYSSFYPLPDVLGHFQAPEDVLCAVM